jgi:hypothetical protein
MVELLLSLDQKGTCSAYYNGSLSSWGPLIGLISRVVFLVHALVNILEMHSHDSLDPCIALIAHLDLHSDSLSS